MILMGLVRMETAATVDGAGTRPGQTRGWQAPTRFSAMTGGASYAIYLSHILILTVVWNTGFNPFVATLPANLIIAAYILLMAAILGFSVVHYTWLEKPLHRLFKRWLGLQPGLRKTTRDRD